MLRMVPPTDSNVSWKCPLCIWPSALEVRNGPNIAVEFHLAGKTIED